MKKAVYGKNLSAYNFFVNNKIQLRGGGATMGLPRRPAREHYL
jgi:hypothetical protein